MKEKQIDGTMHNRIVGVGGEISVENFLRKKGYKILKTNFRTKMGEIDIIAKDGDVIVFVEVKRRLTLAYGRPAEAVDARKQAKIRRVAEFYLLSIKNPYAKCRFDVVEVLDEEISHIENAF